MWTITDDVTNKDFPKEHQIKVSFTFTDKNTGAKYYANSDVSPEGFMRLHSVFKNKPKWSKQIKNTEQQKAETGKINRYEPANATSIIASLVEPIEENPVTTK
jgi:hypothetical protein